mgnify:CR=1 FL=1
MSKSTLIRLLFAFASLALLAAACGSDNASGTEATGDNGAEDDGTSADDGEPAATPEPTAIPTPTPPPEEVDNTDLSVKPLVAVPDGPAPADLVSTDIVVGEGTPAESGDFAIMQYVGVSYSNGLQFDASWDRGQPFTFTLGEGSVIQGWDDGVVGMAPGGRRELVIPPDQAYGEAGSGSGAIGPNETLVFVVDLIGVVPAALEKPEVDVPAEPATELTTTDLVEGTGAELAENQAAWVHYVGVSQSTGEQFDASWDRGIEQPIAFVVGIGQVIEGWDQGLVGMKVGGRREIVIPPELAYGEAGAGEGVIAPNETLVFVVDLIGIS